MVENIAVTNSPGSGIWFLFFELCFFCLGTSLVSFVWKFWNGNGLTRHQALQTRRRGDAYVGFGHAYALDDDLIWVSVNRWGGMIVLLTGAALMISCFLGSFFHVTSSASKDLHLVINAVVLLIGCLLVAGVTACTENYMANELGLNTPCNLLHDSDSDNGELRDIGDSLNEKRRKVSKTVVSDDMSTYTVQNSDTLSVIALRYNLTVGRLISINKLKSTQIFTGQVLSVPSPIDSKSTPSTPLADMISNGTELLDFKQQHTPTSKQEQI